MSDDNVIRPQIWRLKEGPKAPELQVVAPVAHDHTVETGLMAQARFAAEARAAALMIDLVFVSAHRDYVRIMVARMHEMEKFFSELHGYRHHRVRVLVPQGGVPDSLEALCYRMSISDQALWQLYPSKHDVLIKLFGLRMEELEPFLRC